MDAHDINGDGLVDVCEMANYMRFLNIPQGQCMEEARAEIEYILDAAEVKAEPSYISQDEFVTFSLAVIDSTDPQ